MTTGQPRDELFVSLDTVLAAVADEQRRAVLTVLDRTDEGAIPFETLASRVAALVRDGEVPEAEHKQRVRTSLHHSHLPKLAACGLVAYDADAMTVRKGDSRLRRQLRTALESYEQWE